MDDGHPYKTSTLDSLAKVLVPSQTMLYLKDWRSQAYDVGLPDYSWDPSTPDFIAHAHALGFYVMLHADTWGVATTSPDFPAVQPYQVKDPLNLQLVGENWSYPASFPFRYAFIDPADSAYRKLLVARLTPAIQTLKPDAIHLDESTALNDGNGPVEGITLNQGLVQLRRDLLGAFPNLVLGGEQTDDMQSPWQDFYQPQPLALENLSVDLNVTPPVPISAYVLRNVHPYVHQGTPDPYEVAFVPVLYQHEGQAVLAGFRADIPDYSQPDVARYLNVVRAFQTYGLQPAWDTDWSGANVMYQGLNRVSATLTDDGTLIQFALHQPSGSSSVLYQRVHGVNEIDSPFSVPNWPAFNGTHTSGLDPAGQYWLDAAPNNPALPHITGLPPGARVGVATGTLVTPQFSYFQVVPPAQPEFNFLSSFWAANLGLTFNRVDYPLQNAASATNQFVLVGGAFSNSISTQPPFTALRGGEVFFEYSVPIPASQPNLVFQVGIADAAIGQHDDPMTFKVEINGAIVWQQDVSPGGWQEAAIDLGAWAGQTVTVRFVSNPGPNGNPIFARGAWSGFRLSGASAGAISGITLAVPQTVTASRLAVTGGSATIGNGTVTVDGLPPGGTILVLNGEPQPVAAGQSLFNIPFTISGSSDGHLAGPLSPGTDPGVGSVVPNTSAGVRKQQTLYAPSGQDGQYIYSWLLQVPASPGLAFSFSAGFMDARLGDPKGYLMSVRVNGTALWEHNVNPTAGWQYGAIDLSPWAGKPILLELITDSMGPKCCPFTYWAELAFSSVASAQCVASLSAAGPISAPAAGGSGTIAVTAGSGCDWTALSAADWITVSPANTAGNGAASYTITANTGPARQGTMTVAGRIVTVTQDQANSPDPQ